MLSILRTSDDLLDVQIRQAPKYMVIDQVFHPKPLPVHFWFLSFRSTNH